MFTGSEIVDLFTDLGVTHIVWVPDSTTGQWEDALERAKDVTLLRVCREGEAWPLAAGLLVGGQLPLVLIQNTGLFESGDALRNILFDLELPMLALIGARNWLNDGHDTAKRFTKPIVEAWGVEYLLAEHQGQRDEIVSYYKACIAERQSGFVLLAE